MGRSSRSAHVGPALLVWAVVATSSPAGAAGPQVIASPQWELTVGAGALVAAASTFVAGAATGAAAGACVARFGKHQPSCWAGGMLAGAGLQVLVLWGVLPELFRAVGASPGRVRSGSWAWVKWPALVLAASVVTFGVGAAVEQHQWNRGQTAMLIGLGGAVVSSLTLDVFALIGAAQAAREGR